MSGKKQTTLLSFVKRKTRDESNESGQSSPMRNLITKKSKTPDPEAGPSRPQSEMVSSVIFFPYIFIRLFPIFFYFYCSYIIIIIIKMSIYNSFRNHNYKTLT